MMENGVAGVPELSPPLLALGVGLALFGWVLYWGGLTALGAVVGAGMGSAAGVFIAELAGWQGTGATAAAIGGGVGGAILGALALRMFHTLVFFLCGMALGSLGMHHGLAAAQQMEWTWAQGALAEILIRAAGAFLGGLALAALSKFIIVLVTSTLGTFLIVGAWPTTIMYLAAGPIWICSVMIQYAVARRLNLFARAERKKKEEE